MGDLSFQDRQAKRHPGRGGAKIGKLFLMVM